MHTLKLIALSSLLCSSAFAGEQHHHAKHSRSHEAHVHGEAKLMIAKEQNKVHISFESPAINLVGFEHEVENKQQKALIHQAEKTLSQAEALFNFQGGSCTLNNASVNNSFEDEEHKDEAHHDEHHDENHHKDEGHAQHKEESHFDFSATYEYHCQQADEISSLDVKLMKHFPAINEIEVQWIMHGAQGASKLNANENKLSFK